MVVLDVIARRVARLDVSGSRVADLDVFRIWLGCVSGSDVNSKTLIYFIKLGNGG